jgi:hypothetical protein
MPAAERVSVVSAITMVSMPCLAACTHSVRAQWQRTPAACADSAFPTPHLSLVDRDDDVAVEADRILALVPWADTLNHCSSATERSILQYDVTNDAAVLFAHRDYAEGEEVFDSYGPSLTPAELLLDYGFVDAANSISAITVRPMWFCVVLLLHNTAVRSFQGRGMVCWGLWL